MGILAQLEVDFDMEIVEDFVSHFAIMCENMEPLIIGMSKADRYSDNIGDLFRIFHNMKSAAGFLKLDPIIKLAVLAEDIAEEARVLKGPASEAFIDWLLLVSDQFEKYRKDVEDDAAFFTVLNPLIIKVPHQLEKE
ncbi:Hpt domain-containing protein [Sulfurospirillum sp. MES]|jgi:two-component system chemotaxis sensor kinase CheA|uniref:Hpt domain-containing protein n=1 Tax=Sulfurospirillum sp. MES TaxID=1565314 RepID=UPI0005424B66|nr:Hpt domain-containing protein [Sulfurospirillum sp. MES]KHG34986.1 MAG: histidine phosphotransferase [Sulfurospirillum sp. MES]